MSILAAIVLGIGAVIVAPITAAPTRLEIPKKRVAGESIIYYARKEEK